ncbi:hypothetical protein AB0N07_49160 [Streptomyces sp. NPDC051172]|uniref:hypothetical protein n=1 Tax=Streptomyces sp. NPDC051172 TaxID=3155796 RepID=UPI0034164371
MGGTPLRAHLAEEFLNGQPVEAAARKRAAALVAARCVLPASDPSGSRAYRVHLAETLTCRALIEATSDPQRAFELGRLPFTS